MKLQDTVNSTNQEEFKDASHNPPDLPYSGSLTGLVDLLTRLNKELASPETKERDGLYLIDKNGDIIIL